jgi:hypothetical protein
MKSRHFVLILFAAAMVAGTASFFVTRARVCDPWNQSCQTKVFQTEALRLADMLESETSSRDQIISQARKVFSIRQSNIISVAHEVLKTDAGRRTIPDLIPCPMDSNQANTRSEAGYCCIGPGCCCKFDSVQSKTLAQSDPNFLKASNTLQLEIANAHRSLVSMLNDPTVPNEKIIGAIQDYLEKSSALEIRAIEYFITIRQHLTAEQRKQIFCWCAQQLRNKTQTHFAK